MELFIIPEFEGVFSVNGTLCESSSRLKVSENDVVYVTAFPLGFALLPYTVKICPRSAFYGELAKGYRLSDELYCLKLSPRHAYIYDVPSEKPSTSPFKAIELFNLTKRGKSDDAFALLSDGLKSSLSPAALSEFFSDYTDAVPDPRGEDRFFLITKSGADLFEFRLKGELIDDVNQITR